MSDKGVCRTAPATQCLLNIHRGLVLYCNIGLDIYWFEKKILNLNYHRILQLLDHSSNVCCTTERRLHGQDPATEIHGLRCDAMGLGLTSVVGLNADTVWGRVL